jgi:hypothetical protein
MGRPAIASRASLASVQSIESAPSAAAAAMDYPRAGRPVPPEETPPQAGSPMFQYVVRRLCDSFALPWGVLRNQRYMARARTVTYDDSLPLGLAFRG